MRSRNQLSGSKVAIRENSIKTLNYTSIVDLRTPFRECHQFKLEYVDQVANKIMYLSNWKIQAFRKPAEWKCGNWDWVNDWYFSYLRSARPSAVAPASNDCQLMTWQIDATQPGPSVSKYFHCCLRVANTWTSWSHAILHEFWKRMMIQLTSRPIVLKSPMLLEKYYSRKSICRSREACSWTWPRRERF